MAVKKEIAKHITRVEQKILTVRGQRVMLDSDLAELYGVETRVLNQAVSRNRKRFPPDFMFRLDRDEFSGLTSQNVMSKPRGGRRHPPHVFTEQGVAMLSSVLKSEHAIEVNIAIMRAFVHLRTIVSSNRHLAERLAALERTYDSKFRVVFEAIRRLMEGDGGKAGKGSQIGFRPPPRQ